MPIDEGVCRICGTYGRLSFEHVPPKSAFNNSPALLQTLEDWVEQEEGSKEFGRKDQRGFGAYTLCPSCNNNTGAWYGSEYVKWARGFLPEVLKRPTESTAANLWLVDVYPLRLLKQAIACLFSVNGDWFAPVHPELVRFVLDKDRVGLPPKYEIYLTLVTGSMRAAGVSGKMTIGRSNLSSGGTEILTEFAFLPFSFRMHIDSPSRDPIGRVSHFAGYGYHEKVDLQITLPFGEIHSPFPGDYRSKAEMGRDILSGNFP